MLLLEILRRQPEYQAHIKKGEWVRRLPIHSIHGSRITLLGTGDIGLETLRRLRGFNPAQITVSYAVKGGLIPPIQHSCRLICGKMDSQLCKPITKP